MDYEKKYKEALERAKEINNEQRAQPFNIMTRVFPELAESEDEKIRKALIKYLSALDDDEIRYGVSFKDMRAWLEKQGEQKPKRMISAEAKEAMYDRPAWNEEDQSKIRHLIAYLEKGPDTVIMSRPKDEWIDFLKSLKDRVQPQQEWSQTDNEFADDAIACVTRCYEKYIDNKDFYPSLRHNTFDIKRWLIDVRERLKPQNTWKPSDEQMRVLDLAIRCGINRGTTEETTLVSLFNDLKKLKG